MERYPGEVHQRELENVSKTYLLVNRKMKLRTPCDSSWADDKGENDGHSVTRCSNCHSGFTLQRRVFIESRGCKLVEGEFDFIKWIPEWNLQ